MTRGVTQPLNPNGLSDPVKIATAVNQILKGRQNNVRDVTLRENQTTTVITDPRIGVDSAIGLHPLTLNAAGALATTYPSSLATGTATLTHANAVTVDRTFRLTIS